MHIPKTAGLSLQGIVRRRHKKEEERALIYTQKDNMEGFEDNPELKIVMGHYRYGYHRFSKRPHVYHTFLRDPLQHVISHYQYTFDHPEKFEFLPEGIENLLDFVKCKYGYNLQTRFVSGIEDISENPRGALQKAKENLLKEFDVIGLTEEFDKSLILLGRAIGWKIIYYLKKNKGKAREKVAPPSPEEVEQIRELLKYDMELYEFGQMLFRAQMDKNEWVISREKWFKKLNPIYQKLNPSYIRLKLLLGLAKR